jgi:UPF0755 protein
MSYPNYPRKRKNPLKAILAFLILLAVLVLGAKGFWEFLKSPVDSNGKMKAFVIRKGESVDSIASNLESEGLIRSAQVFKFDLKFSNMASSIQAGDFKLSPAMSNREIIETLSKGSIDKWVTLLEGWRAEEIARQLDKELGVDESEFLKEAEEGYMFPDTYLFNPEAKVSDIASILKNTFNARYDDELQAKVKSKGLTPEQGVILASIVEREARSDGVRAKVAGIYLNRLKEGMKLDADATVQYAKDSQTLERGGKVDKFWKPITREEYSSVKSDFNTYLIPGLPPGPICNPSLSSLKAVANAESTPYLFYYHDSKGNSYYARTLDEHNENVANHR